MRPRTLRDAVARAASAPERFDLHLDEFLDEFYEARQAQRQAMLDAPPPSTDVLIDAYVAAAAEYLARVYGLEPPAWVRDDERFLSAPFFTPPDANPKLRALLLMDSPVEFRRRYIFTEREPLRRKLGPVRASRSTPAPA